VVAGVALFQELQGHLGQQQVVQVVEELVEDIHLEHLQYQDINHKQQQVAQTLEEEVVLQQNQEQEELVVQALL
tara:strand:- start:21 stop:242 length:222 start_codon:yes stop_codon:yes gene_type:complete